MRVNKTANFFSRCAPNNSKKTARLCDATKQLLLFFFFLPRKTPQPPLLFILFAHKTEAWKFTGQSSLVDEAKVTVFRIPRPFPFSEFPPDEFYPLYSLTYVGRYDTSKTQGVKNDQSYS